jgi:hypothetical protein
MSRPTVAVLLGALILAAPSGALCQEEAAVPQAPLRIEVEGLEEWEFPVDGEATVLTLTGGEAGASYSLATVYRPNSRTADTVMVGPIGADRLFSWTPKEPGLARIIVLDPAGGEWAVVAERDVAVRFSSPPPSGLLIFILAGALLFGGASLSMRRALEADRPPK